MKDKIKKTMEQVNAESKSVIRRKRLLQILDEIFNKQNFDLSEISLAVDLYEPTVVKYLKDKALICSLFTEEDYEEINMVVGPIIEQLEIIKRATKKGPNSPIQVEFTPLPKQKQATIVYETAADRKYRLVKGIVEDILYSRYNIQEIADRNYVSREQVNAIVRDDEYLIENFSISSQILRAKIESNGLIAMSKKRTGSEIVIKDAFYIWLVKDDVYYLEDYDYNRLRMIGEYLKSECNLEKVCEELQVDARAIWSALQNEKIVKIIKPEHLEWFKKIRAFESIFYDLDVTIKDKKGAISLIIEKLKSSDYNVNTVSQELGIPRHLMRRLLNKDMLLNGYGKEFTDMIIDLFKDGNDEKKRGI